MYINKSDISWRCGFWPKWKTSICDCTTWHFYNSERFLVNFVLTRVLTF